MSLIYMDHHATTPMDKEVLDAMMPFLTDQFGNPNSNTHAFGHTARDAADKGREQVAELVNADSVDEIVFTASATESINLAIKGFVNKLPEGKKAHIITLPIEHKAVLQSVKRLEKQGHKVDFANVDNDGVVDLEHLKELITPDTTLVSIQTANSEIGTIQPIFEIGKIVKNSNALFHTDAVQAIGRMDVDVVKNNIDMLSISGHKIYGPKGIGALYVKKRIKLDPIIDGGGQEKGMRSGTLNVPGIIGLGKAAEIAKRDLKKNVEHDLALRNRLSKGIEERLDYIGLNGHPTERLCNNLNYSFAFVEGESLILACRQVALSSGSACTSTSLQSSYVLHALNVPDSLAHCSLRFGLGRGNTEEHVDILLDLLEKNVNKLREMSPLYDMAKAGIDIDSVKWGKHSH